MATKHGAIKTAPPYPGYEDPQSLHSAPQRSEFGRDDGPGNNYYVIYEKDNESYEVLGSSSDFVHERENEAYEAFQGGSREAFVATQGYLVPLQSSEL